MRIPEFTGIPGLSAFLRDLVTYVDRNDKNHLHINQGNNSLLLFSPDGSVFEVKVDNAGVLAATKIAGAV